VTDRRGPATQDVVRRQNLAAVVQHLHRNGATSRSTLTSLLSLNRSTIGALVADLTARGLVSEAVPEERGGTGRPSPVVRLCAKRVVALAIEVEVNSLGVALIGIGGEVIAERRVPYARPAPKVATVMALLPKITRDLLALLPNAVVAGVGVGVAGIVRRADGLVHHAPNLGWRDVPLGAEVAATLHLDVPVHVGNDADLGAIAEHTRGAGVGVDDLVFVSSEVGVGSGVLSDGELLTGADGYFGELGHLPLFPRGQQCRCGARGCWETEVGTQSLLRRAGHPDGKGIDAVRSVLEAAASGDKTARAAVTYVADRLALGLAVAVNMLNPRMVVLGGYFGEMWPLVQDRTLAILARHALPVAVGSVQIVAAALGPEAMLVGAAETALSPVLVNPTLVPLVS